MSIYYEIADKNRVDGIFVNTILPPAAITGVGFGTIGTIATLNWGPQNTPIAIANTNDFRNNFGFFSDLESQLSGPLVFSLLYVCRVGTSADDFATSEVETGFDITAKYLGSGGNDIKYTISAATDADIDHFKLSVQMISTTTFEGVVYTQASATEVYDNLDFTTPGGITDFQNKIVSNSKFITVGTVTLVTRPANIADVFLLGGVTGTPTQSEYSAALFSFATRGRMNTVVCSDSRTGTDVANTALYQFTLGGSADNCIVTLDQDITTAITQVIPFKDTFYRCFATMGRVKKTDFYGRRVSVPVSMILASTISSTQPNESPAATPNARFFASVSELTTTPVLKDPSDYILLRENGICAPEYDKLYGFKFKSGVTTQTLILDGRQIYTRRMTDYLSQSIAAFLVNFQNAPYTPENQTAVKSAIEAFIDIERRAGRLPTATATSGPTYLVDTFTSNTPDIIAQGIFIINYKQKLISTMDFINLQVSIGASVVVTQV